MTGSVRMQLGLFATVFFALLVIMGFMIPVRPNDDMVPPGEPRDTLRTPYCVTLEYSDDAVYPEYLPTKVQLLIDPLAPGSGRQYYRVRTDNAAGDWGGLWAYAGPDSIDIITRQHVPNLRIPLDTAPVAGRGIPYVEDRTLWTYKLSAPKSFAVTVTNVPCMPW